MATGEGVEDKGECGCDHCVCENADEPTIDTGISIDKTGPEAIVGIDVGISIPFGEKKPIC